MHGHAQSIHSSKCTHQSMHTSTRAHALTQSCLHTISNVHAQSMHTLKYRHTHAYIARIHTHKHTQTHEYHPHVCTHSKHTNMDTCTLMPVYIRHAQKSYRLPMHACTHQCTLPQSMHTQAHVLPSTHIYKACAVTQVRVCTPTYMHGSVS